MKNIIHLILTALFISTLMACGSSSGSSGPSYTADYTADATPSSGTVTLQKSSVGGSTVYVDVVVTGINGLGGAAIKLDYDPAIVSWPGSCEEGGVFSALGVKLKEVGLDAGVEGRLVIGITGNEDVDVIGSETLVTIPFRVIAAGESAISFSIDSVLTDSVAPEPGTILSYSANWVGGTISGM